MPFTREIPCFIARPLLALTCASYPSGISINIPVGTKALSIGFNSMDSSTYACKSTPAEPFVSNAGKLKGLFLIILTFIFLSQYFIYYFIYTFMFV
ncbi:hypothetical protein SDC9_211657 [bioreactor metagenome]|uniref:Uncharacterized protein n=1 Tax=bioreactor metagenome TaxID=1076179 RepID=A0A645JLA7_9ZZZZ